jgi:2-methylcitrate dehydratase PrpD
VIRQVKRSVLDVIAIAFAGYQSEPSRIIHGVVREMNGPAESTVFGSGLKTSCFITQLWRTARWSIISIIMDAGFLTKEARVIMGHHGELIAPILAVAERQHSNGPEVITNIVPSFTRRLKNRQETTQRLYCLKSLRRLSRNCLETLRLPSYSIAGGDPLPAR